jgi:hypothetical protein
MRAAIFVIPAQAGMTWLGIGQIFRPRLLELDHLTSSMNPGQNRVCDQAVIVGLN